MEFKEKNTHYLHPDFEDTDAKSPKRPSPLALLVQTCKNINSTAESREFHFYGSICSPNSRKLSKRCRSDSSSNDSSTGKEHLSQSKRSKTEKGSSRNLTFDFIETKSADTSTDDPASDSGSGLINNLINFVKSSSSSELFDSSRSDLWQFLASKCGKENDLWKSKNDCKKGKNQFNVANGYHLDSSGENTGGGKLSSRPVAEYRRPLFLSDSDYEESKTGSAIKYCMYCGKFIPVLPILVTHIRLEHSNTAFLDPQADERFNGFSPYPLASNDKSSQAFSFLTDYLSSPFQGLSNLIC